VTETRAEQKVRTRRAILDAALALSADSGLATLSLRSVTREVGIVPTAFYRHFASVDEVGLALVDESFVSLRAMLRAVREPAALDDMLALADTSVRVLAEHVRAQQAHFGFIARERVAGPPAVRAAIRREIELCEHELTTDLARLSGTRTWSNADLSALSTLIVRLMVAAVEELLDVAPARADAVVAATRTRLRMVLIGAVNWRSA